MKRLSVEEHRCGGVGMYEKSVDSPLSKINLGAGIQIYDNYVNTNNASAIREKNLVLSEPFLFISTPVLPPVIFPIAALFIFSTVSKDATNAELYFVSTKFITPNESATAFSAIVGQTGSKMNLYGGIVRNNNTIFAVSEEHRCGGVGMYEKSVDSPLSKIVTNFACVVLASTFKVLSSEKKNLFA